MTYKLNPDYWAKDLPVNVGRNNFAQIQYDYYRDDTVMLEAFKAGEFDLREENQAKFWATSYTGRNFDQGLIKKEEIAHQAPASTQGFISIHSVLCSKMFESVRHSTTPWTLNG